jgi:hypothetical protein
MFYAPETGLFHARQHSLEALQGAAKIERDHRVQVGSGLLLDRPGPHKAHIIDQPRDGPATQGLVESVRGLFGRGEVRPDAVSCAIDYHRLVAVRATAFRDGPAYAHRPAGNQDALCGHCSSNRTCPGSTLQRSYGPKRPEFPGRAAWGITRSAAPG